MYYYFFKYFLKFFLIIWLELSHFEMSLLFCIVSLYAITIYCKCVRANKFDLWLFRSFYLRRSSALNLVVPDLLVATIVLL